METGLQRHEKMLFRFFDQMDDTILSRMTMKEKYIWKISDRPIQSDLCLQIRITVGVLGPTP
jgi:hypothetical protein